MVKGDDMEDRVIDCFAVFSVQASKRHEPPRKTLTIKQLSNLAVNYSIEHAGRSTFHDVKALIAAGACEKVR